MRMIQRSEKRAQDLRNRAFSAETVRGMEHPLLERGVPLMRMAAQTTAQEAIRLLEENGIHVNEANVVLLAGAGNNGGDGLYAAAALAGRGATLTVIAVGKSLHSSALLACMQAGGKVLVLDPESRIPGTSNGFGLGEAGERLEAALDIAIESDLVIDAMTGIGARGPLRGLPATLAQGFMKRAGRTDQENDDHTNGTVPTGHSGAPLVLAVDTPSGVGVDDGTLPGIHVPADVTMTFGALKPCAMLPPASYACGKVILVDFGFDIDGVTPACESIGPHVSSAIRLPRAKDAKYSRGVVGLITGSARFPGAAVLSSKAAARANVGMIRYLGPAAVAGSVVSALPEAVAAKGHVQAWVVGSGVPDAQHAQAADEQRTAIRSLLGNYDLDRDADRAMNMPPICVDAGALDLLPRHVPGHVVLTPHAGELASLLRRLDEDTTRETVEDSPIDCAARVHDLTGATVLLKGAVTAVLGAAPRQTGDDHTTTVRICGSGPAWLATAGSGDVLAGIMGALLAQQDEGSLQHDPEKVALTAASAAYIHGLAGQIASGTTACGWQPPFLMDPAESILTLDDPHAGHPIIASDIVEAIPEAFERAMEQAR